MWHRDTNWADDVGKMAPKDFLHAGSPQTFNLWRKKHIHTQYLLNAIKWCKIFPYYDCTVGAEGSYWPVQTAAHMKCWRLRSRHWIQKLLHLTAHSTPGSSLAWLEPLEAWPSSSATGVALEQASISIHSFPEVFRDGFLMLNIVQLAETVFLTRSCLCRELSVNELGQKGVCSPILSELWNALGTWSQCRGKGRVGEGEQAPGPGSDSLGDDFLKCPLVSRAGVHVCKNGDTTILGSNLKSVLKEAANIYKGHMLAC